MMRAMKKMVAASAACVLVAGLAACGSDEPDGPEVLAGTQEYASVDELGGDLRERGIDCTPTIDQRSAAFTNAGRCTPDSLGTEMVMGIFTSEDQLDDYKGTLKFVASTLDETGYMVVGSNWIVNCSGDQACAETVSGALGGMTWVTRP